MEKEDTKIYLKDSASKEYVIYQTERVDIQEELNKTITELQSQLKKQKEIIDKAVEYINKFKDSPEYIDAYDITYWQDEVLQILEDKEV